MVMAAGSGFAEAADGWRLLLNIPARNLEVYKNGKLLKEFSVAVGKPSTPTPQGEFVIARKIKDPTWYPEGQEPVPPGPDNPLGPYWLGLNIKGYGIHGNNNPFSIGYWVSNGCVRLKNEEIEYLFENLPIGTPVEIIYDPALLKKNKDRIWLELYADIYNLIPDMKRYVYRAVQAQYPFFRLHEEGLWRLIGEHRPVLIEIPEMVEVYPDGESYAFKGFFWKDQVYLPREIPRLWGEEKLAEYPEFMGFLMANGGKVYGYWDEQARTVILTTIRLSYQGKPWAVRGWLREEPYLNWRQLLAFLEETNLGREDVGFTAAVSKERLLQEETLWISLSNLRQLWPQFSFDWQEEKWEIRIEEK